MAAGLTFLGFMSRIPCVLTELSLHLSGYNFVTKAAACVRRGIVSLKLKEIRRFILK